MVADVKNLNAGAIDLSVTAGKPSPASAWLSQETFSAACAALPLVSIDILLLRPGSAGPEVLLGLRNNRPAQGWWFTPGGRIRKNEAFVDALRRVAVDELGLDVALLSRAKLLGVWDHFYEDSAFASDVSTHYVNLPHAVELSAEEGDRFVLPACGEVLQHSQWKWMAVVDALADGAVHGYAKVGLGALALS